jgi:GDP-4-dehydro-6-deoxy-D-mannose reductase
VYVQAKYLEKILITGHSGFLGQALIKSLKQKYELIGISRKIFDSDIVNIKKDIRKININDIPKNVSCIIHLAGLTDVYYCQENSSKCFDVNVGGTQNMLEIAKQRKSKFIFISSSHIYGNPKKLPILETQKAKPISNYAYSKLNSEILCESYSKNYNLDVSIARIFSVYGPASPPHHVITKIIKNLIDKEKIKLGNLFPKRDFIYIEDVVSAIEILVKKTNGFNIYNIGTGNSSSISDLIEMLSKITNKTAKIETDISKIRKNEVKEIRSDISKMIKLGWKPKYDLNKGLKLTVKQILKN